MIRVVSDAIVVLVRDGNGLDVEVYGPFDGWDEAFDYARGLVVGEGQTVTPQVLRNPASHPYGVELPEVAPADQAARRSDAVSRWACGCVVDGRSSLVVAGCGLGPLHRTGERWRIGA